MRVITVDLTKQTPVMSQYGGELGEHQAVVLKVVPETAMQEDEDISFYYLLFAVEGGLVSSRTYDVGEDIICALWGQLTEQKKLRFQLVGTNGLETIIAKSPIITLTLGDSLDGTVIGIDDNRDSLIAMIGGFNQRLDTDEAKLATIDEGAQKNALPVEIAGSEVPTQLKYTGNEIVTMFNEGHTITFEGNPIIGLDTSPVASVIFWCMSKGTPSSPYTDNIVRKYGVAINSTDYTRNATYFLITDQYAEQNKIDGIKLADGITALPIVGKMVTLPDFAYNADLAAQDTRLTAAEGKLATIESYAQKNVQPDWAQLDTSADDYIKNKIVKGTIESGDTGYVTGGDVYNAIQSVNTELYEIAADSTTALYTGAEIYALYQAHKPLAYMSYPVIFAVQSSSAAYGQVALYFCSGGSPAVIRSATIPNTAKTVTIAHSGTTVTDANNTKLNAIHDGVIASGDTGYTTGNAVYTALNSLEIKYTEIAESASTALYTGAEVYAMWAAGTPLTYQSKIIIAGYDSGSTSYSFYCIDPVTGETDYVRVLSFTVTAQKTIISFLTVGFMLTSDERTKLNAIHNGTIADGDTGYITGDAAYDALAAKQNTLTAGTNITIQNDVISAAGGGDAEDITYDNTDSGLTATDVQAAIDELAQGGGGFVVSDTAPSDTGVLWIDPTDNTIDETLADGDTSSY